MRNGYKGAKKKRLNTLGRRILYSKSPVLIATDGGHGTIAETTLTSVAAALCILDIRENENLEDRLWEQRPVIPLVIRNCILPQKVGNHGSDISQGEAMGVCLAEEMLPQEIARCVIMDSQIVRARSRELRDNRDMGDRVKIRGVLPSISKSIMSRLALHMNNIANINKFNQGNNTLERDCDKYEILCKTLAMRHQNLINVMEK